MKNFKIEKSNWKRIPIDSANFVLTEAKEYLSYTLNESDKITNRAYSIILFLSAILTAIVGYTYSKIIHNDYSKIIFLNIFFVLILTTVLIILGYLVFPRKLMVKGRKPIELTSPQLLNNPKLEPKENYLSFIIQEIENTQLKIDYNLNNNRLRQNILKKLMFLTAILFPIYLIFALILSI